ncbi:hypothetical protein HWV62_33623 [Athelia sp. TMB]|nr:hypothetical protein HWV62_33623 [Athelia sp. TMB]
MAILPIVLVFGAQLTMYTYDWLLSISEEVEIVSARGGLTWPLAVYFVARYVAQPARVACADSPQRERAHALAASRLVHQCVCPCALKRRRAKHLRRRASGHLPADCRHAWSGRRPIDLLHLTAVPAPCPRRILEVYPNNHGFWSPVAGHRGDHRSDQLEFARRFVPCIYSTRRAEPPLLAHLHGARICTDEDPAKYTKMPVYATFVNDTIVFLAITYRLTADAAVGNDWRSRLLSIVRGKGLRRLSRSLLQSGQLYYGCVLGHATHRIHLTIHRSATILFFFANLAVLDAPLIPTVPDHVILINMYTAFANMMACLVLRNVALGAAQTEHAPTGLSGTALAAAFQLEPLAPGLLHD